MKPADYYKPLPDKKTACLLCPHHCIIANGANGFCLTRENKDGVLYAANYCRPVSTAIDPIEKKPLYHFYPGSSIFSAGPNGCTFKCNFCQNCSISQEKLSLQELDCDAFVTTIIKSNTIGIAYTYSEPYIWYETIMAVGTKIKSRGLKNVMVTNGYMEPEPLDDLLQIVDAMNIDIKSMDDRFYHTLCKGDLAPVLRTCETVKKKAHLEITNLLIPEQNDSDTTIEKLVQFIASNLGKDTPLHFSRYFPRHTMNTPATPEDTLPRAWEIAKRDLHFVYLGNIVHDDTSNTCCPKCNACIIKRTGYTTDIPQPLEADGRCPHCGMNLNMIH